MITAVSVSLYAFAVLFAAMLGTMAEKNEYGQVNKFHGRFIAILTTIFFVLAAILQVAA